MSLLSRHFRWRIATLSLVVSGMALLVFTTATSIWIRHEFLELIETNARSIASMATALMKHDASTIGQALEWQEDSKYRVVAIQENGERYLYRDQALWHDEDSPQVDAMGYSFSSDGEWRIRRYERGPYAIFVAANLAETEEEYLEFVYAFALGLPFSLILIAVGGWWLGNKASRPIVSISRSISQVTPGELRIRVSGTEREDEIGDLARLINGMLERIENGYAQAKRFTGDASHELRTPLSILQSELEARIREADAEGTDQESNGRMLEEVRRLKALTNSLLFLSRVDSGTLVIEKETIVLEEVLNEIVEDLRGLFPDSGIEYELAIEPELGFEGDTQLIYQLFWNLLRNATLYNLPEAGRVKVSGSKCEEWVAIEIANTSLPIPKESQKRIFDRFYRCSPDRNRRKDGFGLGLNIAREIAHVHGGELEFLRSEGGETVFEARFPS